MQEYTKFKRGSEWRKWDLHLHSDASDGKMNCQQIVDKAIENNIDVIALTDHHTAKNIDLIKSLAYAKGLSVISGIEFRTEYGEKSVHIIGLFPDEFGGIQFNSKNLEDFIINPLDLAEARIIQKGKEKLISEGKSPSDISNEIAFKTGLFLVQVDFKKAADLIHKHGGLVIPHAGTKENSIDTEMKHEGKPGVTLYNSLGTVKEELFKSGYIDICEIRKENDNEDFYLNKFNKPSIIASDAHSLNEIGSKYVWIKADPTFEGLRQITFEPKDRVKIQNLKPDSKSERHIISEVQFLSSDNLFGNQKLLINENLNAIIGGKSSGKSLLLHSMANSIDPEQVERISKRLGFEGYNFAESYDFEVIWKNGDKDILSDSNPDNKFRKITYIPQLYINYLAEKNNKDELNALIQNILLQDSVFKSFYEQKKDEIANTTGEIETQLANFLTIRSNAIDLNKKIKENGTSESISKAIKNLEAQIAEGQKLSNLSPEEVQSYNVLSKEKEKLENSLRAVQDKETVINKIWQEVINSRSNLIGEAATASKIARKGQLDRILDELTEIPEDIAKIKNRIITDYETLINNLKSEIADLKLIDKKKEITAAIEKNKVALAPYLKKLAGQQELKKLTEQLQKEIQKKIQSENFEKQFKTTFEEYKTTQQYISDLLSIRYTIYKEIIEEINSTKREIGEEITLNCALIYRKDNFPFYEQPNKAAISKEHYFNTLFNDTLVNYDLVPPLYASIWKVSDEILYLTQDRTIPLKQKIFIEDIFKGLVNDAFELDFKVTYKQDELLQMSPGKKGTVLLILFLQISSAEYPILIDQPEDNLDNRTIYELLCTIIKEKKSDRQIIIVSHNANLVVATDSENIVVANQEGQDPLKEKSQYRFEYVNGSLEYSFKKDEKRKGILFQQGIKEHVCDVLEGGDEAFKQRERKYSIK